MREVPARINSPVDRSAGVFVRSPLMGGSIFMFHLMPWAHLAETYEGPAWVTCPTAFSDPARGHAL
jgi:hypothetical protein